MLTLALNNQYGRLPESITDSNERVESSTPQTTNRNYLQRTIRLIDDNTSSTTRLVCTTLAIGTLVIGSTVGFGAASYFIGQAMFGCNSSTKAFCHLSGIEYGLAVGLAGGTALGSSLVLIGMVAAGTIALCSATHSCIEDIIQESREQNDSQDNTAEV